jgi:hypothetical protein
MHSAFLDVLLYFFHGIPQAFKLPFDHLLSDRQLDPPCIVGRPTPMMLDTNVWTEDTGASAMVEIRTGEVELIWESKL